MTTPNPITSLAPPTAEPPLDLDQLEHSVRSGWRPDRPTTLRLIAALRTTQQNETTGWDVVEAMQPVLDIARGYAYLAPDLADAIDHYDTSVGLKP